jgi:signal transduction histidine kinase/ActR/RegA family two-component response regulator
VFRTLRAQLFLGSLAIFVAMLGLLLWNAQHLMSNTLSEQFETEAEQLRPLLNAAVGPLLASRDLLTLNVVMKQSVVGKGLAYVQVRDNRGLIVASMSAPGLEANTLSATMPVVMDGEVLGEVHYGIRTSALERSRNSMLQSSLIIGLLVLLLGATLLALCTTWVTHGLRRLADASKRVADGDYELQLPDSPMQEVQQVSTAFNLMTDAVRVQLKNLEEGKATLRAMIDTLAESLMVIETGTDKVLDANEAALVGYSLRVGEALLPDSGKGVLFHGDGEPMSSDQWPVRVVGSTGEPLRNVLIQVVLGPQPQWLSVNASPLFHAGETRPYAVVATLNNVTRHVQAERALRVVNEDLERRVSERTAEMRLAVDAAEKASRAKSEFLSRMSHELRTPLNAILGFSQLLAMPRAGLHEQNLQKVRQIEMAGWHLLELINEVLDLARIEAGAMTISMETLDLCSVVGESVEMVSMQAQARDIRIVNLCDPSQPRWVTADRKQLKQVFNNLLSNAVKYNRPQGMVTVSVSESAGRLSVSVMDTGRGLSASEQERLYEPFTRFDAADNGIQGTGIGLVITRHLVELMGGSLALVSQEGAGSTFGFDLAVAPAPFMQAPPGLELHTGPNSSAMPLQAEVCRVLYIEDNPSNVELLRQVLALRPAYQLSVASDGLTGLDMTQRTTPDVAIVDIDLPGIDGLEVCRRLRADPRTRHIPLIGLSANAMSSDETRALQAGFDVYLTKPLNVPRLFDELKRLQSD